MSIEITEIRCPSCGAGKIEQDSNGKDVCAYCGTRLAILDRREPTFPIGQAAIVNPPTLAGPQIPVLLAAGLAMGAFPLVRLPKLPKVKIKKKNWRK